MSNNHLNFAKKMKDDEYYTRRFLVDIIFNKTVEVFGMKNVLYVLAADSDCSFYTKYAKSRQLHYVNNIDFYNIFHFIFTKQTGGTTVVITNPPFSILVDGLKKVLPYVQANALQLCLIVPIATISTSSLTGYLQHCYFYAFNGRMTTFFHDWELKSVNTMLMTTFPLKDGPVHPKDPPAPTGNTFITPVTRIVHKAFYEACGYEMVGIDQERGHNLFKRFLGVKK